MEDGTILRVMRMRGDTEAEYLLASMWIALANQGLLPIVWPGGAPSVTGLIAMAARTHMFMCSSQPDGSAPIIAGIGWIGTHESVGLDSEGNKQIKAEVGMVFLKQFQGHGLCQEFCDMMLDYGFEKLNMVAAYGTIPVPNRLARAFAKRMGFQSVATLPDYTCWPDKFGTPRVADAEVFCFTRNTWSCRAMDKIDVILSESGQEREVENVGT